ncbi:hypothetical protein ACMH5Q_11165 [Aquirufa lenticrescens]
MDEQISFDEVYRIINSKSLKEFFRNIILGDQRYGRIIYVIYSAFSFFTFNIFGETGLIVTNRFLGFLFIIIAYLVLIKTFIKNEILSVFTFIVLLSIPSTAYYSTMPKPEPLLILLLSLFVFFYVKKSFQFGRSFILLGLAFGCKVSLLPTVLIVFLFSLSLLIINSRNKIDCIFFFKKLGISIFYFLLGLFIAVPILALSVIDIKYLKIYLYSTILASGHGADDLNVNILSWVLNISNLWFNAPNWLTLIVFILSAVCIFLAFKSTFEFGGSFCKLLILFLFFSSLIFPIILIVKRVWYFYLHIGFAFYVILIFFSISVVVKNGYFKYHANKLLTIFYLVFFLLIFYLFKGQFVFLSEQSIRTKNNDYLLQKERYKFVNEYLLNNCKSNKSTDIYYSPQFFRLTNNSFNIELIYGFFHSWDVGKDYVFLSNSNHPILNKPSHSSAEYLDWEVSIKAYNDFVIKKDNDFYYVKVELPIKGIYLFKKMWK